MAETIEKLAYRKVSDYVLVRAIGRGTHYTLYQAVEPRGGRMVVIKILHVATGKPGTDAELAATLETRLEREGHALSSLCHPNIPAIYEMGEKDGHPFLVMEYLYGHPLRQHLDQRSLPMHEAAPILEQVASAVDAVHAEGILHRDIRASNIMLLHDGTVKLVEFGLARQPGDTTVTLMGALVGEPAYMAPEQLRGLPASPQSDIWALGVLLYEMVAGRPPFEGANFQMTAHQVIMEQPAPVPGVSEAIRTVLMQGLEKDPEQRYPSASALVKAFQRAASSSLPPAPMRAGSRQSAPAHPQARQAVAWAVGVFVLLGLSILLGVHLARPGASLTPTASAATLPLPPPASPSAAASPSSTSPSSTSPSSARKSPYGVSLR